MWSWCLARGDYGKSRPAVVVQADFLARHLDSVTVCLFTSDIAENLTLRVVVEPTSGNGLKLRSQLMIDKIQTYPRKKVFDTIGALAEDQMQQVDAALLLFFQLNRIALPTQVLSGNS
ncbi:MAG: type II toxin-antitoxin system PemK/MazF family toxin [Pararhizobium sp.]